MIDAWRVRRLLEAEGLYAWAAVIEQQLDHVLHRAPHGDWLRWQEALDQLPRLGAGSVDCEDGALNIRPQQAPVGEVRAALLRGLKALHPWRKGPYRIADVLIDTEWRSDWKWARVQPHLTPLADRLVLDVGCGNGYYGWRMLEAGARRVIGIDPTALFLAQFLALRGLLLPMAKAFAERIDVLPLGVEAMPTKLGRFDTIFSMGVLYHRRSPIDHLLDLRGALRPGGELVLETLVIEGREDQLLVPRGRYAKMRNVWFIPTTRMLENWLRRCGFRSVRTVDVSPTRMEEQRSTEWMTFESLADFLDPVDTTHTIEGYPAPRRAVLIAEA